MSYLVLPGGLGPPVEEPVHVACQKRCLFADGAAQHSSVPEEATARLRKQGRVRLHLHQCHYSVTELRNKSGAIVRLFCRIRCEHDGWKARVDRFCFRVSAIESCRATAVAVAQIFSVASRKFRTLVGSTLYPAQNTGCRLMVRLVLSGERKAGRRSGLDLHIEKIGELAVIECEGRVVRSEAAFKLREAVTSLRNARIIVLDLSEVRAIEGAGLGILLFLQGWAHRHHIQFKLFNPVRSLRDRLELINSITELDITTLHEMMELLANADRRYALAA